ncbi:MAG: hypothetical protein IPI90_04775 [Saprospiraceae bacterium]|nr:hypothetical protein [Candidatus Vicinibacter affinis]
MRYILFGLIFLCFYLKSLRSQDSIPCSWTFKGYQKLLNIIQTDPSTHQNFNINFLHNRLQGQYDWGENFSIKIHLRTRMFFGEGVKLVPGFANLLQDGAPLLHLSKTWLDKNGIVANSMMDRLVAEWQNDRWYISLGRQRVNWGMHNLWNPNDIFNAYNLLDFDYEERPGSDVFRARYYPGISSSIEFAYQPATKLSLSTGAFLMKWNRWQYDFQFLAGHFRNDAVLGAAWAGNLGNAGFKGEFTCFVPGLFEQSTEKASVGISIMSDYSWKNGYYGIISLLYQSNIQSGVLPINSISSSNLSAKNLFPFTWSLYSGMSKQFADRWMVNASFIYAPPQKALIFLPSTGFEINEAFDVDFTAQFFWGDQSSKFDNVSNAFYLRGRYSF